MLHSVVLHLLVWEEGEGKWVKNERYIEWVSDWVSVHSACQWVCGWMRTCVVLSFLNTDHQNHCHHHLLTHSHSLTHSLTHKDSQLATAILFSFFTTILASSHGPGYRYCCTLMQVLSMPRACSPYNPPCQAWQSLLIHISRAPATTPQPPCLYHDIRCLICRRFRGKIKTFTDELTHGASIKLCFYKWSWW